LTELTNKPKWPHFSPTGLLDFSIQTEGTTTDGEDEREGACFFLWVERKGEMVGVF